MNRPHSRRRAAAVVALVLPIAAAAAVASATARDERSAAGPPSAERARPLPVEIVLTAGEARWKPGTRRGVGRLTLDRISPRMHMMARAPRRELAVVPASLLGVNWDRLFRRHDGVTNVVLSVPVDGAPRLFAARAELVARRRTGDRMTFRVTPLERTAHRAPPFGRSPRSWQDATLYVDPSVTDAIKAMWQALLEVFSGEDLRVPPNPTRQAAGGRRTFDNGSTDSGDLPAWAGPKEAQLDTPAQWEQVQEANLNEAGAWVGDLSRTQPDVFFRLGPYNGLALFNHEWGRISFEPVNNRTAEIRNLALFESAAESVNFNRSEVGSANLRGLNARTFTATNSAFDTVDLTGSRIGDDAGSAQTRSSVTNAVFINVETNRRLTDASGTPDAATEQVDKGAPVVFSSTDFVSVSFQNVDFKGAGLSSTTFQGCGLQNVDFKGAEMGGQSPTGRDNTFEPTFDNSILEGVRFDGASLRNVSFRNVDFSGGRTTFNGATLDNVDFTGATGLQTIDWSKVTVRGNVYGLAEYSEDLNAGSRSYIRSLTFDGEIPDIDPETGYDIEPGSGYLIEPRSGVRLEPDAMTPVDPVTGDPLRDPQTGEELFFDSGTGRLYNLDTGRFYRVDYETGRLEDE